MLLVDFLLLLNPTPWTNITVTVTTYNYYFSLCSFTLVNNIDGSITNIDVNNKLTKTQDKIFYCKIDFEKQKSQKVKSFKCWDKTNDFLSDVASACPHVTLSLEILMTSFSRHVLRETVRYVWYWVFHGVTTFPFWEFKIVLIKISEILIKCLDLVENTYVRA